MAGTKNGFPAEQRMPALDGVRGEAAHSKFKEGEMRILALVTDAFGVNGGIARYNCALLAALSQSASVSEVVALPRFGVTPAVFPAKIRQLPPHRGRAAWSMRAIGLAAAHRFDAVFCGHLNAAPLAAVAAWAACAPWWLQVHGTEAWQPRGTVYRRSLAQASLVTSVSRYTRHKLLSWAGLPPHRVRVLPNTIGSVYAPRGKRPGLAERYALDGKRVILTVGRLAASERYKGHDRIIGALPEIAARVPNAVYLIVGSGDDETRLRKLAAEHGVAGRTVFAGQIPDDELPDYFALADVFAMPSTGEGFGIVFLEAAASGVPVLGGNRDGSADALADGAIGRLVDPESREEIAAALTDMLSHPGAAAPANVRRFSFDNFARHVDDLLRDFVR